MIRYPKHLLTLIQTLKKLPGVGSKSAERFAFQLLDWPKEQLHEMAEVLKNTSTQLAFCQTCGCLTDAANCLFCLPERAEREILCIIGNPKDAFSIEETREYFGLYHVLPTLLSPLDGMGPEQLNLASLKQRIQHTKVKEIIIALDSTLEGDATTLFIKDVLSSYPIKITRLAFGLPVGSSLDYIDGGTLAKAFLGRT